VFNPLLQASARMIASSCCGGERPACLLHKKLFILPSSTSKPKQHEPLMKIINVSPKIKVDEFAE